MGTPTHLYVAKRMLKYFPALLHDVYLSEEYYGENVLHMACVAEDASLVKWLLDEGSDFHRRCYGNFFCCDDQKKSRGDSLTHEEVDICLKTDYYGYVSWGEYPMNFAAVLNQEEIYRLILAQGGNCDLKDTNGCTVTHIMVVYDNINMFDMAVECGAAINIENNQKLTPLTTAAYLARMDMFFHIASIEREIYWQLGNVTCSAYPLEYLDTIHSHTGELNTVSALNLIVFGPKLAHLDLIEYVVVDLLKVKWNSFVKKEFFTQLYTFTIFFFLASIAFILRPGLAETDCSPTAGAVNQTNSSLLPSLLDYNSFLTTIDSMDFGVSSSPVQDAMREILTASLSQFHHNLTLTSLPHLYANITNLAEDEDSDSCEEADEEEDSCHLLRYQTFAEKLRLGCEASIVIIGFYYLVKAVKEARFLGRKIFVENMILCPSRVGVLIACLLLQAAPILRIFCFSDQEDTLAIIIMILLPLYFLFFCRGFKLVGPMVIMIYRMLAQDLLRFGIIYFIFIMGFSQSFYIMFESFEDEEMDNPMPDAIESILQIFIMSLAKVDDMWDFLEAQAINHVLLAKFQFFVIIAILVILLLNLLIAMMGDTYAKIAEIKNELMRQWARTVLIVERGIPPPERLRQQNRYYDIDSNGNKALVMKQFLANDKVEEISEIIEMKITHRKNINRRKAKFGFESVSTMGLNMAGAAVIVPDGSDGTDPENPYATDAVVTLPT